jgi:hypothetical protein
MTQTAASTARTAQAGPFSRLTGPPIFVSGCNRGGTTVLSQILSVHPQVCNVGRGPFNEGQHIWRRRFRDRSRHRWALPPWRLFLRRTERHATPERVAFFRQVFDEAMAAEGRMLEKTPANAIRIPFIDRLYPDCFFIHVLRDGRHTTASLVARRVALVYAPHQWVAAHGIALADLGRLAEHRVVRVRYEELVRDPEPTLARIAERCGLGWSPADREPVLDAARGTIRTPECRWSRFSAREKRYVLWVIDGLQRELGYPVEA